MINDQNNKYEKSLLESKKRYESKRNIDYILKLYIILGTLGSVFGLTYFTLITLNIEFSRPQQYSLLVTGASFALAMASYGMLLIIKERRVRDEEMMKNIENSSDFLKYWGRFENISRDFLDHTLSSENRNYNKYSIREILELLFKKGMIDKSDLIELEEAIQVRNSLVHKGNTISKESTNKYIELLTNVIQKLMPM